MRRTNYLKRVIKITVPANLADQFERLHRNPANASGVEYGVWSIVITQLLTEYITRTSGETVEIPEIKGVRDFD